MTLDEYFPIVMEAMKKKAVYSKTFRACVISRVQAQLTLLDHMEQMHSQLGPAPTLLKEGERRGWWEISIDKEAGKSMVVLKQDLGVIAV